MPPQPATGNVNAAASGNAKCKTTWRLTGMHLSFPCHIERASASHGLVHVLLQLLRLRLVALTLLVIDGVTARASTLPAFTPRNLHVHGSTQLAGELASTSLSWKHMTRMKQIHKRVANTPCSSARSRWTSSRTKHCVLYGARL